MSRFWNCCCGGDVLTPPPESGSGSASAGSYSAIDTCLDDIASARYRARIVAPSDGGGFSGMCDAYSGDFVLRYKEFGALCRWCSDERPLLLACFPNESNTGKDCLDEGYGGFGQCDRRLELSFINGSSPGLYNATLTVDWCLQDPPIPYPGIWQGTATDVDLLSGFTVTNANSANWPPCASGFPTYPAATLASIEIDPIP